MKKNHHYDDCNCRFCSGLAGFQKGQMSSRSLKQWQNPEIRERMIKSMQNRKGHPCSEEYKNKMRTGRFIICETCGRKVYKQGKLIRRAKHYFCSFNCKGQFYSGEKHHLFNNWSSFLPYPPIFDKTLKNMIRKRDNFTCQECGYTQKQLGYALSVHHIDFNKNNCNTNNLISLCKSCHTKTEFDRDKWIGYYQNKVSIGGG